MAAREEPTNTLAFKLGLSKPSVSKSSMPLSSEVLKPVINLPFDKLVWPVRGFFVKFDDAGITQVSNVVLAAAVHDTARRNTDGAHLFWLLSGEWVVQVAYCVTVGSPKSRDRVSALRLQTNLRSSQWFGVPHGTKFTRVAKHGEHIHAIYGPRIWNHYSKLKVVCSPLVDDAEATVCIHEKPVVTSAPGRDTFWSCSSSVRAVVVDSSTLSVGVLSDVDYRRYVKFRDRIKLQPCTHVEELVDGEMIRQVGCTVENGVVRGLRLLTNKRTTPWFGNPGGAEITSATCGDEEGAYICGFSWTLGDVGKVVALGVVTATPAATT